MKLFSIAGCHFSWLILSVFSGVLAENTGRYEGFKVLTVTPESKDHLRILRELRNNTEIDFWRFVSNTGDNNTFSVSPKQFENVLSVFKEANLPFDITIENLQKTLERELQERNGTMDKSDKPESGITHDRYYNYNDIVGFAEELARTRDFIKTRVIGKTYENRDIIAIVVSKSNGQRNPGILLDAGIHAREWIAPATALYLLDQLATKSAVSDELLDNLDWYIVPVVNPDGYEFTFQSAENRLWRKNRSPTLNDRCPGVDLNRNFGFHWNGAGGSFDPCQPNYSGPEKFSEPESAALRDFMQTISFKLTTYLSLHSFGNFILYPWGHTKDLPHDARSLKAIGEEAVAAMVNAGSQSYKVGSAALLLNYAAGRTSDYAKAVTNIGKSFAIELPGGGNNGFDMPPSAIESTARIIFEGLRAFAKRAKRN